MTNEEIKAYDEWFAALGCVELLFYIYYQEAVKDDYYRY